MTPLFWAGLKPRSLPTAFLSWCDQLELHVNVLEPWVQLMQEEMGSRTCTLGP